MTRSFPVRGVIEGFYGPPWSHRARLDVVRFLGARGMNAYVYAPKSDDKHRERWRDAYDAAAMADFAALAATCRESGMRFGFAIAPGLDIEYSGREDRQLLFAKLAPLLDVGVDWFVLALDDIPPRVGIAHAQASLAGAVRDRLLEHGAVRLSLVPTEYVGTRPSPYLSDLASELPAEIDVMWTGPTVCSPVISAPDARAWRDAVGGHPLLLWDNYPVNDSVMERELHLGPYRGRDPDLSDAVEGVLCNPMLQPHASLVALATAAEFLSDPDGYVEEDAWGRAIRAVGGDRSGALRALARACADGPLSPADELPAQALVADLADELRGPEWCGPMVRLRDELAALRDASGAWADGDDELGDELAPWLAQAALEADTGIAALRLLQHVRPVARRDQDGSGRAARPDAELSLVHCFALLYAWTAARETRGRVVLGPRFALHPAVVQLADGRPGLDIKLTLREHSSVVDHLARLALEHYARWASAPGGALTATSSRGDVELAPDGRFTAPSDGVVTIRHGELATRVLPESGPPFRDARLA